MKQSQRKFVEKRLLEDGEISRNTCLQNYITRLGAIINTLNNSGWEIEGEYRKEESGKDYVYYLRSSPYQKKSYYVPALNKTIIKYE